MAATAWLMSFSSCIVWGFDSYTVLFKCPKRKSPPPPPPRGGGEGDFLWNWRASSATQFQPSESLCYIGCTSTWWQHDCWPNVQTFYAICILTPERISQGHVQNGRPATFSWPVLYKLVRLSVCWNEHWSRGVFAGVRTTFELRPCGHTTWVGPITHRKIHGSLPVPPH